MVSTSPSRLYGSSCVARVGFPCVFALQCSLELQRACSQAIAHVQRLQVLARDLAERNLSSINFPEFFGDGDDARCDSVSKGGHDAEFKLLLLKQTLLEAAEHERDRTNAELSELYAELEAEGAEGKKIADLLGVYYAGEDQFSDMYLVRDVTNSTRTVG